MSSETTTEETLVTPIEEKNLEVTTTQEAVEEVIAYTQKQCGFDGIVFKRDSEGAVELVLHNPVEQSYYSKKIPREHWDHIFNEMNT